MRVGKINWTSHSNLPILSVDVQPNGYRFITGGSDNNVCVWNLLPVISEKYEMMSQPVDKANEDKQDNELNNTEESKLLNGDQLE